MVNFLPDAMTREMTSNSPHIDSKANRSRVCSSYVALEQAICVWIF